MESFLCAASAFQIKLRSDLSKMKDLVRHSGEILVSSSQPSASQSEAETQASTAYLPAAVSSDVLQWVVEKDQELQLQQPEKKYLFTKCFCMFANTQVMIILICNYDCVYQIGYKSPKRYILTPRIEVWEGHSKKVYFFNS